MSRICDVTREPATSQRSALASGSVPEHLFRGAAGLVAGVLAIVVFAVVGPSSAIDPASGHLHRDGADCPDGGPVLYRDDPR
jgi:hypothetical protein